MRATGLLLFTFVTSVGLARTPTTVPTAPVSATPIPVAQEPTGSVEPSQQTGTLPGLPGVVEPRGVAPAPTPSTLWVPAPASARAASAVAPSGVDVPNGPIGGSYDVSGLVVRYEPGRSISLQGRRGPVRVIALPSKLMVPPDLGYGKYATVHLQRVPKGSPKVLSVTMGVAPAMAIRKSGS